MKYCKIATAVMIALSSQVMAEEPSQTDVIIVTGEKMDRSIDDTTTAITVINGDDAAKKELKQLMM